MIGPLVSGQPPISLVIPCRAEYVSLCRLVAGVVGARESLDEEVIADIKLVVTEACTCFLVGLHGDSFLGNGLEPSSLPSSLRVDFNVMPEAWEITLSDPERRHHFPGCEGSGTFGEAGLGLTIIKALVDSMERIDSETEGSVLRLVKRLSPRDAPAY